MGKEKEKFGANWRPPGEDHPALFTPSGRFVEIAKAIPANNYRRQRGSISKRMIKKHPPANRCCNGCKGRITYEGEVAHKEMVFDEHGK